MSRLVELDSETRCATGVVLTKEEGVKAETVAARPERAKRANFILAVKERKVEKFKPEE